MTSTITRAPTSAAAARLAYRASLRTARSLARATAAAPPTRGRRLCVRVRALAVGDKIPEGVSLSYFDSDENLATLNVAEACAGKKVVLFAVPGAFTPTCSHKHLPAFVNTSDELRAKGVNMVGCVAVNDPFVMDAWSKQEKVGDKVSMLADGSGLFTKALGVELNLVDKGFGYRSRRYSMLVEDGEVTVLNLEEGGAFTLSGPEDILEHLVGSLRLEASEIES